VIACDSYSTVRANMRAVGATVEALRAIQRHGATSLLERAFTGFAALPPKGGGDVPGTRSSACPGRHARAGEGSVS
jgi:cytochrome c5